jgi:hypothetical protein
MELKDNIMAEMGKATIFPANENLSLKICCDCNNHSLCSQGKGISLTVHEIQHLFLPDYKNSWTLTVDLPDCRQPRKFFYGTNFSLFTYCQTGSGSRQGI